MKFNPVVQVREICEEVCESGFGCVQGERVRVYSSSEEEEEEEKKESKVNPVK